MQNRRLHHHRVGQHRRRCGVCRHFQLQSEQGATRTRRLLRAGIAIGRPHTHADSYSKSNTNTYGYCHTNGDSYSYCYGYADGNSDRYANCYSHRYSHAYSHFHAQTDTDAEAKASSYSAAPAVSPEGEVIRLRQGYGGQVSDRL